MVTGPFENNWVRIQEQIPKRQVLETIGLCAQKFIHHSRCNSHIPWGGGYYM
jgi:hypothetical protein